MEANQLYYIYNKIGDLNYCMLNVYVEITIKSIEEFNRPTGFEQ